MELKVAFVIVCLCALAITSTEAGIPKCCIAVRNGISPQMLHRVECWREQSDIGPCDISALVLRVRGLKKLVCAPLSVRRFLAKKKVNKLKDTC